MFCLQAHDRQIITLSLDEQLAAARDYVTEDGGRITRGAQVNLGGGYKKSVFEDPAQPDRYWVTPGQMEGLAVADNSHNAPNPSPLDKKK